MLLCPTFPHPIMGKGSSTLRRALQRKDLTPAGFCTSEALLFPEQAEACLPEVLPRYHTVTWHTEALNPCSLLFLPLAHWNSPSIARPMVSVLLPRSSMVWQVASPAWSFLEVSESGQGPQQPSLLPTEGSAAKTDRKTAQPFLSDTSVAGESWGSEVSLLGTPSVQF